MDLFYCFGMVRGCFDVDDGASGGSLLPTAVASSSLGWAGMLACL
jgi:hypothetical protein